ncbi:SLCO5A1 family protein [Megaselia abdita]
MDEKLPEFRFYEATGLYLENHAQNKEEFKPINNDNSSYQKSSCVPEIAAAIQYNNKDCGVFNFRPALSSGYINSVITTIEKRFDISSSYSGIITSSFEIGNVITIIFLQMTSQKIHPKIYVRELHYGIKFQWEILIILSE